MQKRKESGRWSPHRWPSAKIRRYVRHVFARVDDVLGPYAGALVEHEVRTRIDEIKSIEEFRKMGVVTIGDHAAESIGSC